MFEWSSSFLNKQKAVTVHNDMQQVKVQDIWIEQERSILRGKNLVNYQVFKYPDGSYKFILFNNSVGFKVPTRHMCAHQL